MEITIGEYTGKSGRNNKRENQTGKANGITKGKIKTGKKRTEQQKGKSNGKSERNNKRENQTGKANGITKGKIKTGKANGTTKGKIKTDKRKKYKRSRKELHI